MTDIWLKITGTKRQVRDALTTLGFQKEMLRRNEAGQLELVGFNHHVAMLFIPNLITKFATYDADGIELTPPIFSGPHLMIRFVSKVAIRRVRRKIISQMDEQGRQTRFPLPAGLELVDAPTTMTWA